MRIRLGSAVAGLPFVESHKLIFLEKCFFSDHAVGKEIGITGILDTNVVGID